MAGEVTAGSLSALMLAGERCVLHPERALELPAHRTLVIADVHWGKATTLRAHGIPVPSGGTRDDLARLDRVLARTEVSHLVVLGDLVHSRHAWTASALAPLLAWRAQWPSLSITLVRGNHDAHAGDPPAALRITAVDAPFAIGALQAQHEPIAADVALGDDDPFVLCGHLHPTLSLAGRGGDRVRLSCFVRGPRQLILPAFSTFTGRGAWIPDAREQAFAIVEADIVEIAPRVI